MGRGIFVRYMGKKYEDATKKGRQKLRRDEVKYCDFRHFLGKYSLKQ